MADLDELVPAYPEPRPGFDQGREPLEHHLVGVAPGPAPLVLAAHRPGHHGQAAEEPAEMRRRAGQVVDPPRQEIRPGLAEMQEVGEGAARRSADIVA